MMKKKKIKKPQKETKTILEYYYMIPTKTDVKALEQVLTADKLKVEQVEIWTELDLMEVVLADDSLIFQNARDCFEDEEDLDFIKKHQIQTIYQLGFSEKDIDAAGEVLQYLIDEVGGMVCSDSDDFEPIYDKKHSII